MTDKDRDQSHLTPPWGTVPTATVMESNHPSEVRGLDVSGRTGVGWTALFVYDSESGSHALWNLWLTHEHMGLRGGQATLLTG